MSILPKKYTSKEIFNKVLIAVVTVILVVLMFPKGESIESELTEGAIWLNDDLIASFSFPIIKSEENYQTESLAAEKSVYPVFLNNKTNVTKSIDSLQDYDSYLVELLDKSIRNELDETSNPSFLSDAAFTKFKSIRMKERNLIQINGPRLRDLFVAARFALNRAYKKGILNINTAEKTNDSIAVRVGNVDRIESISKFLLYEEAEKVIAQEISRLNYQEDIENTLREYTLHFLIPNLVFSPELTNEEIEQAKNNVSMYSGIVNENERIIAQHERISKEAKLKIESYKEAKGSTVGTEGLFLQFIGKYIHIALLLTLLGVYLALLRKNIFDENTKLVLISLIIIFVSFITFLINQIDVQAPVHFLIFIPAASMLLTIIFDSRMGFFMTVILALVAGALRGNDYTFAVMNIIAGGLSVYSVRDIKNRSQIFRSFLIILLGYFFTIIAFGLERFAPVDSMLVEFAFAGSNALISPVLTY